MSKEMNIEKEFKANSDSLSLTIKVKNGMVDTISYDDSSDDKGFKEMIFSRYRENMHAHLRSDKGGINFIFNKHGAEISRSYTLNLRNDLQERRDSFDKEFEVKETPYMADDIINYMTGVAAKKTGRDLIPFITTNKLG